MAEISIFLETMLIDPHSHSSQVLKGYINPLLVILRVLRLILHLEVFVLQKAGQMINCGHL
jgi:hypothetical protein